MKLSYIPPIVISICVLYYREEDFFGVIAKDVKLSDNKKCITREHSQFMINDRGLWTGFNCGSIQVPSTDNTICEWILDVDNPGDKTAGISVGITSLKSALYYIANYGMAKSSDIKQRKEYGKDIWRKGGQIIIHLDLRRGEIRFSINKIGKFHD